MLQVEHYNSSSNTGSVVNRVLDIESSGSGSILPTYSYFNELKGGDIKL